MSVFLEGYFKVLRWIEFGVPFLLLIYNLWNWVSEGALWDFCSEKPVEVFFWSLIVFQFLWGFCVFEMNVYFLPLGYEFLYSVIPVILFRSSRPSLFGDVLLVLEEVSSSLAYQFSQWNILKFVVRSINIVDYYTNFTFVLGMFFACPHWYFYIWILLSGSNITPTSTC